MKEEINMFQFFKRVKTIVGSELNSLLDKAEDPVKMLDQFMRDMAEDIREAESAVAKQIANEKMLKRRLDDATALVEKRQAQAEKAVEAGNDDLARRALEDKKAQEQQVTTMTEAWERAKKDSDQLRVKLDEMKKRISRNATEKGFLEGTCRIC